MMSQADTPSFELDSQNEKPLYKQIKEILWKEIISGIYTEGQKIPSEPELSRQFNVSRITIRAALVELVDEGLLIKRQGKGNFVSSKKINRDIKASMSFTEACRISGSVPGSKVIKSVIEDATEKDIESLHLAEGAKVIVIERIRYADDVPVSLETSRFSEEYSFLLDEDLNKLSMYEVLEKKYGVKLISTPKTIELAFASYEEARYLNIPKGYPLLLIRSVPADITGKPVHISKQAIVGDKFKLVI